MGTRLAWSTFVFVALTLGGCRTMTVGSHIDSGLDVTRFRSFDWGPADALPASDPRLDGNPVFRDTLEGAVEKQFARRGFERNATKPDLLIHYHASITTRIDINRVDREYGYCYQDDCGVRVIDYEAGTLVLDIVDAHTNRVIWRGWAEDVVAPVLNDDDTMRKKVTEAVSRMFERFAPPPSTTR